MSRHFGLYPNYLQFVFDSIFFLFRNKFLATNAEKILNEYSDLTSACFGKKIKNLKVIWNLKLSQI
jgi:hypothetical protein